ncbi:hypothetical protein TSAR_001699 [Trichomalopsis sarcophagae]|uniref:CCHC-type domain-containing protein n=1 Tax=Trichomalopsis sarcophagae TaxID=543379 RepID=A0A232EMZ2_9HYME|nr:hypothetical protein TSAR_001699 [Trichomalopsis sarcophagae]
MEEANAIVDLQTALPNDWIPYIPNFKVLKIGQIFGIDTEYSIETLKEAIEATYRDVELERIYRKEKDELLATSTIKLYFKLTTLPERIKLFGVATKVYPYVFNVLQCKKCYRYGHAAVNCG